MERNIMDKQFFDFAAYEQLIVKMGEAVKAGDSDAALDMDDFEKAMKSFHEYVQAVDMSETQIRIAYSRLEGAELRDAVTNYDSSRRGYHEGAIANVGLVNKMAEFYGVGPVFLGDKSERLEVADFCLDVTEEIFKKRKL